jgi:hypothetical protein
MLKTYRIIPLVFILFLFGFTFITVAPVLAQATQETDLLESRINEIETVLCSLAGTEKYGLCNTGIKEEAERERQMEEADIAKYGKILTKAQREYVGKKMCRAFPEALSYQECMQKSKLARTCRQNPTLAECSR